MQGYRIALENCLRCHQAGSIGGTKAKIPWQLLSAIASADPALFSHVVTNPVAVNPRATMPANPAYDAPTLAALTAYFQAVARQSQETP
jgi:mono/diheme cytochrome c family protein